MYDNQTLTLMRANDPEFLEAIRLIRKFFPESKPFVSVESGLAWDHFVGAMMKADFGMDDSLDPTKGTEAAENALASKALTTMGDAEIFLMLLEHAGFTPTGRAVVVPDTLGFAGSSIEERKPFVCNSGTLVERLEESDKNEVELPIRFFDGASDTIIVFESGEALLVNHDDHFFWAKSRIRRINFTVLKKGNLARVEIIAQKRFGCFVRISGTDREGLILIVDMLDNDRVTEDVMPAMGTELTGKIIHISDENPPKVSISIKPSDTGVRWHKTLT